MISSVEAHAIVRDEGLSLEAYMKRWKAHDAEPLKGLERKERLYRFYTRYNLERQDRIDAAYEMSDSFAQAVDAVDEEATWLFITEDWCADAAYSLPIVWSAVERNPLLSLRILERDRHLDVMDRYLTDDARSIPVLVSFDSRGRDHRLWGPKPEALAALRHDWIDSGIEGRLVASQTIDWYEAGGWRHVEPELEIALRASVAATL